MSDYKRYSAFDPAEVHADMAVDPAGTMRAVAMQPAVAEKHRDCAECERLCASVRPLGSRRAKVRLSVPQLAEVLGLPVAARIIRLDVWGDPLLVEVVYEHPDLDEVPYDQESPLL